MTDRKPDLPSPVPGADHAETTPGSLDRALALVRFLRANCPWDAAQTARTLVPHLLEEAHEVADAVHGGDARALEGELGDLLLNLAFQVVVAEEAGTLTADSVTRGLEDKMRRRHPHLYGLGPREEWEVLKAREQAGVDGAGDGLLEGLPATLDGLARAYRMQDRAAGVGFDWESWEGAAAKVDEELEEVREAVRHEDGEAVEEEVGDLLFAVVNLARLAGAHPVSALDRANRKFRKRFQALERLAGDRGLAMEAATLEELDALWDEVKAEERRP